MEYGGYNAHGAANLNATNNWWGSADGPSGVGPGSSDEVTKNVLYDPWLTEPVGGVYFDTGALPNPYPSISGIHNGTITPNQTITVSKLYTYPCPRTGGHTEYVRVYGHGVDESAS